MALTILDKRIASRIRNARAELQLTQSEVCRLAGIHRNTLNRLEHGGGCSIESLYRLARALEISLDSLLEYRKPLTAAQLELWPNQEKARAPYARKPVQSDLRGKSDGLYGMPACVGFKRY